MSNQPELIKFDILTVVIKLDTSHVGAVGGRNFALPIDLAHRLYNSLLLSHKP